jgi:membrane fusion protein (multidrug efflux system)
VRPFSETQLVPAAFRDLTVRERAPGAIRPRALLLILVLLMASATGCGWYYRTVRQFLQSTDEACVQVDSMIVAPKVSGDLRDLQVSDNEPVKTGQLAATIDNRDYVVAFDRGRGCCAQADINTPKASLDQPQAVIAQARDTVNLDQANLTYAQQENDRYTLSSRAPLPAWNWCSRRS